MAFSNPPDPASRPIAPSGRPAQRSGPVGWVAALAVGGLAVGVSWWALDNAAVERTARQHAVALEAEATRAARAAREAARIADARARELQGRANRLSDEVERRPRQQFALQLARAAGTLGARPAHALELLDDTEYCPLDLRDFTWHYLHRSCLLDRRPGQRPLGEACATHNLPAGDRLCVAVSPDGATVVFGPRAGKDASPVELWDLRSEKPRIALPDRTHTARCACFSADGRLLATGHGDGMVCVWDAQSGAEVWCRQARAGQVLCLAFAEDGKRLAAGGRGPGLTILGVASGAEVAAFKGPAGDVLALAFSPDGGTLAAGGADGSARLWDLARAKERAALSGHFGPVLALAYDPAGQTLATASQDGTIKLWGAAGGAERRPLTGHTGPVGAVAFAKDGRALASAGRDGTVRLWDPLLGQARAVLHDTATGIEALRFTADGHRLLALGGGAATVWDAAPLPGAAWATLRSHAAPILATAYSPDGKTFASAAADGTIQVWEAHTARPLPSPPARPGAVRALAYSPDGAFLVAGTGALPAVSPLPTLPPRVGEGKGGGGAAGSVRVWDVSAAAERPPLGPFHGEVRALAFLSGGKVLAVAGTEKTMDGRDVHAVKLLDVASGEIRDTLPLSGAVNALAAAADGKTLAIGLDDGLRLRDTETNQDVPAPPHCRGWKVERVFFVPDGKAVATSSHEAVVLWDLATQYVRGTPFPVAEPAAVALSPDGKRLALVTRDSRALSPDGKPLAQATRAHRLKVWNVEPRPGRIIAKAIAAQGLVSPGAASPVVPQTAVALGLARFARPLLDQRCGRITALAFSPDGRLLVSASQDQTVRLWQLE